MKHPDRITTPSGGYSYTQPETGVHFHYFTWSEILTNVGKHRLANGLDTAWGWDARLEHDFCLQNPTLPCTDDAIQSPEDSPIAIAGRLLWGQLHAYASQYPQNPTESDVSNARYWLHEWTQKVPQFGCNCRSDWARLLANFPIDLSSGENFYKWSVQAHDRINAKLMKPIWNPEWYAQANFGGF